MPTLYEGSLPPSQQANNTKILIRDVPTILWLLFCWHGVPVAVGYKEHNQDLESMQKKRIIL